MSSTNADYAPGAQLASIPRDHRRPKGRRQMRKASSAGQDVQPLGAGEAHAESALVKPEAPAACRPLASRRPNVDLA